MAVRSLTALREEKRKLQTIIKTINETRGDPRLLKRAIWAKRAVDEAIFECQCQQMGGDAAFSLKPSTYNQGDISHPDHEVQMARGQLYRTAKLSLMLHELLMDVSERQGLEGWVQSKITRAADYIEAVFDYLDYEMRMPTPMEEAAAVAPGQVPAGGSATPADQDGQQASTTAPGTTQKAAAAVSPTPPGGGTPKPQQKTLGMVKMSKLDASGKPQGTPMLVNASDIKTKQMQGFHVIGENASGGASSAGGMGASAASGGFGNGFLNGGPGAISRSGSLKKKKKKVMSSMNESLPEHGSPEDRGAADSYYGRRHDPHKYVSKPDGSRERVTLTDPAEIEAYSKGYRENDDRKDWGESRMPAGVIKAKTRMSQMTDAELASKYGDRSEEELRQMAWRHGYGKMSDHYVKRVAKGKKTEAGSAAQQAAIAISKKKSGKYDKDGKRIREANYQGWVSNPSARIASNFMHDPDRAATIYKPNKFNPETGLGGYVANRASAREDTNIMVQLNANLDSAYSTPLRFDDGSSLKIGPKTARKALDKLDAMRPVQRHDAVKDIVASKDAFVAFVRNDGVAEGDKTGPKFTGYWKGTDEGPPGKKMVGSN